MQRSYFSVAPHRGTRAKSNGTRRRPSRTGASFRALALDVFYRASRLEFKCRFWPHASFPRRLGGTGIASVLTAKPLRPIVSVRLSNVVDTRAQSDVVS